MAIVVLCDRCGAKIKTAFVKQVRFVVSPGRITFYDICDKCYNKLGKYMKTKKKENNA